MDIPEGFLDILNSTALAHLATLNADGSPQNTPVWFSYDGTHVIVNSAKGRVKDRNMRRDPRVTLSIEDPDNPYRYVEIRGTVVEFDEASGDAVIDALAKKYMGVDAYPFRSETETRVTYRIAPTKVLTFAPR